MGDDDEAIRIAHLQKTPACRRFVSLAKRGQMFEIRPQNC